MPVLVEVVREANVHAARGRAGQCIDEDRADRIGQADVVDRDLERVLRLRDPIGEGVRDLVGGLPTVDERAELDQGADALAARIAALCARLAA
jgi:hypothetical protein